MSLISLQNICSIFALLDGSQQNVPNDIRYYCVEMMYLLSPNFPPTPPSLDNVIVNVLRVTVSSLNFSMCWTLASDTNLPWMIELADQMGACGLYVVRQCIEKYLVNFNRNADSTKAIWFIKRTNRGISEKVMLSRSFGPLSLFCNSMRTSLIWSWPHPTSSLDHWFP